MTRKHLAVGVALAALVGLVVPTTARATHDSSGLSATTPIRISADAFRLVDPDPQNGLHTMIATHPTDIVYVQATLQAGGYTGWHEHIAESLVIVKSGELTVREPRGARCTQTVVEARDSLEPGEQPSNAFTHAMGAHNFLNETTNPVVFDIVYLVPTAGSPAPIHAATPAGCV